MKKREYRVRYARFSMRPSQPADRYRATCSLLQKMSYSSLPFHNTAIGHDGNYLYMYLGDACNILY